MSSAIWDGITLESTLLPEWAERRHALADAAKAHDWDGVLKIVSDEPDLVNTTRPGGAALYMPLHQFAHGGAPVEAVERLLALGAFRGVRTKKGERPVDVALRLGHAGIAPALEPPMIHTVPADALQELQKSFHAVILERVADLVREHALRLPELEVLTELREPRMWFPVPGMYGGFHYWLEVDGPEPLLVSESWCRVAGGSGQRHEVRRGSSELVAEGFV